MLEFPRDLQVQVSTHDAAIVTWELDSEGGDDECVAICHRLQYKDCRSEQWYDGPTAVGGSTQALLGVAVVNQSLNDDYIVRIKTVRILIY